MPHLAVGQKNTPSILALYAVDSTGHLYDPVEVSFRIVSASGEQVFPATGTEDVTDFGTTIGIFPAWDTVANFGWAPPSGTVTGQQYQIDWFYTDADGITDRRWSMTFDITETGTEVPFWTYISPRDVREEGVDAESLSNTRMIALIRRAQEYIERACRQPFRPVRHTFAVDGHGGTTLFLNVPILGLEYVRANYSDLSLSTSAYRVYGAPLLTEDSGYLPQDNRKNPKIQLISGGRMIGGVSPIYSGTSTAGVFGAGTQAHEIRGIFGFLEPNGQTPELIKAAALRLVLANAPLLRASSATSGDTYAGPIVSETVDRHSITYGQGVTTGPALTSALATSREVQEILAEYKAPLGMGAPATAWSVSMGL